MSNYYFGCLNLVLTEQFLKDKTQEQIVESGQHKDSIFLLFIGWMNYHHVVIRVSYITNLLSPMFGNNTWCVFCKCEKCSILPSMNKLKCQITIVNGADTYTKYNWSKKCTHVFDKHTFVVTITEAEADSF